MIYSEQRIFFPGLSIWAFVLFSAISPSIIAQINPPSQQPISLTDSIGAVIDSSTRDNYHLLPDIKNFVSAQFFKLDDKRYSLECYYRTPGGQATKRINVSSDAFEQTREHCLLVEKYHRYANKEERIQSDASSRYYIALEYASRGDYNTAGQLAGDLLKDSLINSLPSDNAEDCRSIVTLSKSRRALFRPGYLYDRSGRTDVLVFAGYYGVWAGVALPLWMDAKSSGAYASGLIIGPTASLLLASELTKNAEIGRGRASIITLGGHLGTWQGIGWSLLANADGKDVVGMGLLGGLAGITTASVLTNHVYFSEGRGALTGSAMNWGTWYGVVIGAVAGLEGDNLFRSTLLGSDILVVGTAIAAKDVEMSRARVRLISLSGMIGIVAGFGVDLLIEAKGTKTVLAIPGMASVAGLFIGTNLTKNYDSGRSYSGSSDDAKSKTFSILPALSLRPDPDKYGKSLTIAGLNISF